MPAFSLGLQSRPSVSVALAFWRGVEECRQGHGGGLRRQEPRETADVNLETARIGELRQQADVSQGGRRPEAKWARLARQQNFACLKALSIDPCRPLENGVLAEAEAAHPVEDFKILDRVNVARNRECKGTHSRSTQGI